VTKEMVIKILESIFQARELDCMVKLGPIQCILDINLDLNSRKAQKFSTHVVRQLAMYIVNQLRDVPIEVQCF
jgi:hypothetical protein